MMDRHTIVDDSGRATDQTGETPRIGWWVDPQTGRYAHGTDGPGAAEMLEDDAPAAVRAALAPAPIAYAIPIGGGWSHVCPECVAAHREDAASDLGEVLPDAEPVTAYPIGESVECVICERVLA